MPQRAPLPIVSRLLAGALVALMAACSPAAPITYTLTVTLAGSGTGAVTSDPTGIDTSVVGGQEAGFTDGTVVTLSATAQAGSAFVGWTGACAAAVGPTCVVTMDAAKFAGATFDLLGTLYFSQDGNGNGLYTIDLETGVATLVGSGVTGVIGSTVGLAGRGANDPLVGSTFLDLVDVEQDGSAATVFSSVMAEGLTYVGATDLVYAIINGDFSSVSAATGLVVEVLTGPTEDLEGLAADRDGAKIYAVGDDTRLWVYDIATDGWTVVFDTGINWYLGGLAYSDVENVLYAIGAGDDEDGVYRIDPIAQTVTMVGPTGLGGPREGGLAWVPAN